MGLEDKTYMTLYKYEEAGNRTRKVSYKYTGSSPDPEFDLSGDTPPWQQVLDEFYVRDISGKEIAIYSGSSLTQWNIWGLDNVGKINADTTKYYYLKDHLGSIRVILNSTNQVVSAQDYDAWGHLMENRVYQSSNGRLKFVSSELDNESNYIHFGVRQYDSRIGRFNSEEPYTESSYGWSSYVYSANNPLIVIDPFGTDWFFNHESNEWDWHEEKERYMWTGQYNDKGHKTYEKVQGYEELLYFQGSQLEFLKKGGEREKWAAVSGKLKEGKTQSDEQGVSDYGPIPEGKWYVDLNNAYSIDDAENIIDYAVWVAKSFARGTAYINLSPADVNTTRLEGFAIHGGWIKGSAGCIDLTSNMNAFYKSFIEYNRNMLLIVNYTNFKK